MSAARLTNMDVELRQPQRAASPAVPGTRDCTAIDCGARQGMLLRDVVQTADGSRLLYVCEDCGAEVEIAR
jgi:hypothetical protein